MKSFSISLGFQKSYLPPSQEGETLFLDFLWSHSEGRGLLANWRVFQETGSMSSNLVFPSLRERETWWCSIALWSLDFPLCCLCEVFPLSLRVKTVVACSGSQTVLSTHQAGGTQGLSWSHRTLQSSSLLWRWVYAMGSPVGKSEWEKMRIRSSRLRYHVEERHVGCKE